VAVSVISVPCIKVESTIGVRDRVSIRVSAGLLGYRLVRVRVR